MIEGKINYLPLTHALKNLNFTSALIMLWEYVIYFQAQWCAYIKTPTKSLKIMSKSNVLSNQPIVKAHPETGKIITYFDNAKGETFGKVRVDQRSPVINNGFMSFANRSAFITMDEDTAKEMESILEEDKAYPIAGKVVVTESLEPFFDGQEPKTKGQGGDVITHGGAPVYRETNYVYDLDAKDTLLAGDRDGVTQGSITKAEESNTPE